MGDSSYDDFGNDWNELHITNSNECNVYVHKLENFNA